MPFSHPEKNAAVKLWLEEIDPDTMVDVGPGCGTYADLTKDNMLHKAAIEIWGPYVKEYNLSDKYDEVIIADAIWFDWRAVERTDVVILGDVLEHMDMYSAQQVVNNAREVADHVIISLPIIDYPQGEWGGNPYEAHLTQWTHEKFIATFGEPHKFFKGDVVGAYWYKSSA
jgi:hypothetical protein